MRKQYKIPVSNYTLVNCGTSRYHKEISLIKPPTLKDEFEEKWWKYLLNVIKRDWDTDANLNQQIGKDVVQIWKKCFTEEQLCMWVLCIPCSFIFAFGVSFFW